MIRTRFAPSPTGFPHIGHLRTAAYAYVLAKHNNGEFILRIEDTDRNRYVAEGVDSLKNMLLQFGIKWDAYFVQSERKEQGIYLKAAEKMVAEGHAFYCQCPAKNAKLEGFSSELRDPCRDKNFSSGAIKLKVPAGEVVSYHDFVLDKQVSWPTDTVYDATLLKADGFPTYHLAAMADDLDMGITHVIRGHDWMPSTPIHLLVYKYLGGPIPEIGHPSDILSPQGGKLSKRKGSTTISDFISQGYLPEALLNFVILLGWAPKDNRELFTLDEFVTHFDPRGFQKSNPVFHTEKLNWFNGYYIRQKTAAQLLELVGPFTQHHDPSRLLQIIPLVKERLVTLADFPKLTDFFFAAPAYETSLWPDSRIAADHLTAAQVELKAADWSKEGIESRLLAMIDARGWKRGDFFMSLRIAVCGTRFTPPLTDTMLILGQNDTLSRLDIALSVLTK
jgi:glutamyl-tRNA synthetase